VEVKETHYLYTHIKKYLLGTSVGVSVAPGVANIPIIGLVAAVWVTMFIGNQGAEMGGGMAEGLSKNH
jgi:hypothetical protein